ncbi:Sodium/calcium exchanger domain containing protein [Elaphomyces granulatus]
MHKYRHEARYQAWFDEDGEPSSHNPFKKFRTRHRNLLSGDGPDGISHSITESDMRTFPERQRRKQGNRDLGGPAGSSSLPIEASGTDRPNTEDSIDDRSTNKPMNSVNDHDLRQRPTRSPKQTDLKETSGSNDPEQNDRQKYTVAGQLKATVLNSWINLLLIFVPAGIAVNYAHLSPVAIFVVNFIAIVPLAAMLSFATEEIALRTGETIGGLLNATFGNAVELIVAIVALVHKEVIIVQTSLIGSMLSNLLLVLGMCFFFGGLHRLEQNFNVVVAQTASSLLSLAVAGLIIPTAFERISGAGDGVAALSRGTSVILLLVYGAYLFFQLKTHSEIFNERSAKTKRIGRVASGEARKGIANIGQMSASLGFQASQLVELLEDEEPQLHIWVAVFTLTASTALVALCAEFMVTDQFNKFGETVLIYDVQVNSIDSITNSGGLSTTFVGLILLPIVGNAAEHATAVTVAVKDKMDLAISVAVGSSMQVALLIIPLTVIIGWIMGVSDMTLYFDGFQITVLFVTVLLVNYLIGDGKSHWLEGFLLMMMYIIIAIAAW